MKRLTIALLGTMLLGAGVVADANRAPRKQAATAVSPKAGGQRPGPRKAGSHAALPMSVDAQNKLVSANCSTCHDDEAKTGGLSLQSFDAAKIEQNPEVVEKMIRKLRAGMMPPPGVQRPDPDTLWEFVTALETKIDTVAALHPNPGHRPFQRLNRAEYARAVHDVLDLDVDVNAFFPPDTISDGFDNIADVQTFSPTLIQGYLRAASRISSLAVGDRSVGPSEATYKVPRIQSQMRHIDGTLWGTRGGISLVHNFPADGEYSFRIMLHGTPEGDLFGSAASRNEQLDVSINGERVALLDIDYRISETDKDGLNLTTPDIHIEAGPQHVAAAFIQKFDGVVDDVVAPIDHTLADTHYGDSVGITVLPHLRDFSITGPRKVTGISDTPSRRKIFVCRPMASGDEIPCARRIMANLANEAYRRPVRDEDIESLMEFYGEGRKQHDFEAGIKAALQALLASPKFVLRFEAEPASVRPGQNYRLTDFDLASRLSFFLWQSVPDAELRKAAASGAFRKPALLERQVRRMLADPRSESLSTRFASQWLRLHDVDKIHPDAQLYPSYDNALAESFKRETELLFNSVVRGDRNVFDLLTAGNCSGASVLTTATR